MGSDFDPRAVEEVDSPTGLTRTDAKEVEAKLVEEPETGQDRPGDWLELVEALAHAVQPPSPLRNWRELQEAADRGWLITTTQVQQLTGAKPAVRGGETTWGRGSFTFTKAGKIGNQLAWKVNHSRPN
jgi:hypothetical protein